MAYHLYNTEGFILGALALGESGRLYLIFTPRFGLVKAIASGVREEKSKLRYNLPIYSHTEISLVRGREFWRLVGSEKTELLDYSVEEKIKKEKIARIFSFLVRLIHGEEESEALFAALKKALMSLQSCPPNQELISNWEILTVLLILKHLGYLKVTAKLSPYLDEGDWGEERLSSFSSQRSEAVKIVNYLLRHSHL